jgi:hypothetical protein
MDLLLADPDEQELRQVAGVADGGHRSSIASLPSEAMSTPVQLAPSFARGSE